MVNILLTTWSIVRRSITSPSSCFLTERTAIPNSMELRTMTDHILCLICCLPRRTATKNAWSILKTMRMSYFRTSLDRARRMLQNLSFMGTVWPWCMYARHLRTTTYSRAIVSLSMWTTRWWGHFKLFFCAKSYASSPAYNQRNGFVISRAMIFGMSPLACWICVIPSSNVFQNQQLTREPVSIREWYIYHSTIQRHWVISRRANDKAWSSHRLTAHGVLDATGRHIPGLIPNVRCCSFPVWFPESPQATTEFPRHVFVGRFDCTFCGGANHQILVGIE